MTTQTQVSAKVESVVSKVAPLWSLKHFVAVNPFFGLANMPVEEAHQRLQKTTGASLHMDYAFYLEAVKSGRLNKEWLPNNLTEEHLEEKAKSTKKKDLACKTLIDFYSDHKKEAWDIISVDYISTFCSVYFDQEQAFLAYPKSRSQSLFSTWVEDTLIDKTLSIYGLKNVSPIIKSLDQDYMTVISFILSELQLPESCEEVYLHRVLMHFMGWASFIRQRVWTDDLSGKKNTELEEFLAIVLCMEYLFFKQYESQDTLKEWRDQVVSRVHDTTYDTVALALHKGYEDSQKNDLIHLFNQREFSPESQADFQAVFCIDVRSEIIRRQLESVSTKIQTKGYAGFFGMPISVQNLKQIQLTSQCPVFFKPKYRVKESFGTPEKDAEMTKFFFFWRDLKKAWLFFKAGSVSCFSFMGPIGSFYMPKMVYNSFKKWIPKQQKDLVTWKGDTAVISYEKHNEMGISFDEQVELAEGLIKGLSMTSFSKLIAFIGHEASVQNNPYASALDCGACGGHSGRKNAELAAAILNTKEIRHALAQKGIVIPETTLFVSGVHNTTTDVITIHKRSLESDQQKELVNEFQLYCNRAGELARQERSNRFLTKHPMMHRAIDWSQVRPEWGLAGCQSFIAAPRSFTKGMSLQGRAFLHCYDYQLDADFSNLRTILMAPVVVASWINLQYFASTVDNAVFGSGNKILHNVVSALGVFEGSGGDLRVGLPIQSLHDGQKWQHSPEKLSVFVAAPLEAISQCLNDALHCKELITNGWIGLYALSENGKVSHQYSRRGEWVLIEA